MNTEPEEWVILDKLTDIILTHCKGCIVEIGMGTSTPMFVKHAKHFGVVLYSCDIDEEKLRIALRSARKIRHNVFHGTSIDFMEQLDVNPAVVFIDGLHESHTVFKEVDFFLPRLLPGGVIFLHDTLPPCTLYKDPDYCGDVYKVRRHFEGSKDIQCFTFPYTAKNCGLTMLMKNNGY